MKIIKYKDLMNINNPIIIDIRDKYEYLNFHIKKSLNIPFHLLWKYPEKYLNFEDTYYLLCEEGYRSKKLSRHLRKLKYNTISIKNGYKNIKQS